jgi:hypothetical protein
MSETSPNGPICCNHLAGSKEYKEESIQKRREKSGEKEGKNRYFQTNPAEIYWSAPETLVPQKTGM